MNTLVFKLQTNWRQDRFCLIILLFCLTSCVESPLTETSPNKIPDAPFLLVLGVAQDAGYPQAGCTKSCCMRVEMNPALSRMVVSLGVVDPTIDHHWMIEATPDFPRQYADISAWNPGGQFGGIFLTHGHIGHYTGLMHLGKEVMGAKEVPTYVMARMDTFLRNNGPWSQLVKLKNISLRQIEDGVPVFLSSPLSITPVQVPHRDEYTETVGYHIEGPNRSALFIPDIDKWERWEEDINEWVQRVDIALLDATFFEEGEVKGRIMSEIPHPFVPESMERFSSLSAEDKAKVHFIHFNHTNPLLNSESEAVREVLEAGFRIAQQGQIIEL
ncbi:MAG: MBL fold metallo-hydrolase [Bacteroidota bacterium]